MIYEPNLYTPNFSEIKYLSERILKLEKEIDYIKELNNIITCEECGELIRKEDSITCEKCKKEFCKSCVVKKDEYYVCSFC